MSGSLVGQVIVAVVVVGAASYLALIAFRALRGLRHRRRDDGCGTACGCGTEARTPSVTGATSRTHD